MQQHPACVIYIHYGARQVDTLSSIPTDTFEQPHREEIREESTGFFGSLGARLGEIAENLSDLFTLRIDLLKTELRDSAKTAALNSVYIVAGGLLALVALFILSAALIVGLAILLPWIMVVSVAVACLIVGAVYTVVAVLLIKFGINHLKEHGLAPLQSLSEIRKDKQWINEIKSARTE